MRNHKYVRIFIAQNLSGQKNIILNKEQSRYLTSVMRHCVGDRLYVFDGQSGQYEAEISVADKNNCALNIINKTSEFEASPDVTLFYAPVKNAKSEFIVQKATELGVRIIEPIITKNTVKTGANIERYKAVAIEAAEQCERQDIPEILDIIELKKLLPKLDEYNILFCDESGRGQSMQQVAETAKAKAQNKKWCIIIGPEGGFTTEEINALYTLENTFGVGLGARILRADTAIITAISLWQNYFGDFNKKPEFRA